MTQEDIAQIFGVDRSTVSKWLGEDITNVSGHVSYIPDARVKIGKGEVDHILKRVEAGESQSLCQLSRPACQVLLSAHHALMASCKLRPGVQYHPGVTFARCASACVDRCGHKRFAGVGARISGVFGRVKGATFVVPTL